MGSQSQGSVLGRPPEGPEVLPWGEGWKALWDLPQARAAGTMGARRGGGWASARSGLEVEEAGELGAAPWG